MNGTEGFHLPADLPFSPELIAEAASRIFNEIPLNPGTEYIGADSNEEIFSEIPADSYTEIYDTVKYPTESVPESSLKESFFQNAENYYFLSNLNSKKEIPLSEHTDGLVHQQTYAGGRETPSSGLSDFVNKIQKSPLRFDSGFPGSESCLERFVHSSEKKPFSSDSGIFNVNLIRKDFPILHQKVNGKDLIWFDNAATTQKPISVIQSISDYYLHDNSNIHRAAHTLAARSTDAYEKSRDKIRRFIGAGSDSEIVFVRGTTEGINLIANTYGKKYFRPGDEIVLTVLEHHANIVPWQMIAKETGAVIRVAPVNDRGEIILEEYASLLNPKTKFVSITNASNSLGTVPPVNEMIQMAKRFGARVLVDGAQSVSHFPTNVNESGCDFFVLSGHKMFGPTGIGAVYIRKELGEIIPPWQGGGNMIKDVTFEETVYSEPPAKFEAGTPNIADAVGLGAAIDYISKLGLSNIHRYEKELTEYAQEKLKHINGLRLIGTAREKVGVLSFVLKDIPPAETGKLLDREGIAVRAGHHCAQPSLRRFGVEATVRPSLSVYNTKSEIDTLYLALKKITRS